MELTLVIKKWKHSVVSLNKYIFDQKDDCRVDVIV